MQSNFQLTTLAICLIAGSAIAFAATYFNNRSYAAPVVTQQRTLLPEADSLYDIGTSTKAFREGWFDELCLSGDSCLSSWLTGSADGTFSTTSADYWESQFGKWRFNTAYLAPTTTLGLIINASSTFTGFLNAGHFFGNLTGQASTSLSLAANGANCSSGNAPLGVDASGAVEDCFDVWTEAENTAAAYITDGNTNWDNSYGFITAAEDIQFSTTSANYWQSMRNFFSTTSANYWETQQTARTADDLSDNSIEDLSDVASITENYGDLLFWNGTAWADIATSSLNIAWANLVGIPAGFADGTDNDTTYTAGDHLTLTGTDFDVDDDFLLNTGDTGTGNYDFSGATVKQHVYASFSYPTTTAWTGTTTILLGPAYTAESWSGVKCFTDAGTLNVSFYDGTNRMNLFNASTTVGSVTLSTNNTFTASEKRYVDIGTPASSPTKISCTVDRIVSN